MSTPKCAYNYDQLRQVDQPLSLGPHLPPCAYIFVAGLSDSQNSGILCFFRWRPHSTDNDNDGTVIKPKPKDPSASLEPVHGVTISDFSIEVNGSSDLDTFSAGVIQLNNCRDCTLRYVNMKYIGTTPKPKNDDGIVTSQGTTGLIQGCIVDGIPKAGIYIARGTHDLRVIACEVKNTTGPIGQAGIVVSGADRITINDCLSHHNGADGLLIAVNAPVGVEPPLPATNIQVSGGFYNDNSLNGVLMASEFDGVRPEHIQLVGISALNNDGRGISIESGQDVLIASSIVVDSGIQGIWLENVPINPGQPRTRTSQVQISSPQVSDSGRLVSVVVPGIGLKAVEQVLITGGKIFRSDPTRSQNYGIATHQNSTGDTCTNVRILDVDASFNQLKPVIALNADTGMEDMSATVQSGYYRIQSFGIPEGEIYAPPGSEYVDISTGIEYRKTGSGKTGWSQAFPAT